MKSSAARTIRHEPSHPPEPPLERANPAHPTADDARTLLESASKAVVLGVEHLARVEAERRVRFNAD